MELQILGKLIIISIFSLILFHYFNNFENINIKNRKIKEVLLFDKAFQYDKLNLNINDKIVFRNVSLLRHNVTIKDYDIPNSPLLNQFESHTVLLSKPGAYIFNLSLYEDIEPLTVIVK